MKDLTLFDLLKYEEGFSSSPYTDTEGYVTIGVGTKLSTKNAPLEYFTLKVTEASAEALLQEHLKGVHDYLQAKTRLLEGCPRYIVLASMCYQLGEAGLNAFKNMWKAIDNEDWETAAKEALDSRWAAQTPNRAKRHAEVLRTGSFEGVY